MLDAYEKLQQFRITYPEIQNNNCDGGSPIRMC